MILSSYIAIQHAFPIRFESLARLNRRGYITSLFIAIIAAAMISYLIALFMTFGFGFETEHQLRELSRAKNTVAKALFELQEQKTNITNFQKETTASMEKIRSIQYLRPSNIALFSVSSEN